MSTYTKRFSTVVLVLLLGFAVGGCEKNPFGRRSHETIGVAQAPAPVRAAIDQLAQGRSVGEIEKKTVNGKIHYEVTFRGGSETGTIFLSEDGKRVAPSDDDDD